MNNTSTNVIGLMSGTSLDGVDLALIEFSIVRKKVKYRIVRGETIAYSTGLLNQLKNSKKLSGLELTILDRELGRFYGNLIKKFIKNEKVDLIASHGHTVFHQPDKGLTLQIGSGAEIAAITGIKTVCDFRSTDIALGGQGAPLVPFGDELLFPQYDYCLNLGGFSNISYKKNKLRVAFDICACNLALNHFANEKGKYFDDKGKIAKSGKIDNSLLKKLNGLDFYSKKGVKSLGAEWLEKEFLPIVKKTNISTENKLATLVEHIAIQISKHLEKNKNVLITGGGAYNDFLIQRIKFHSNSKMVLPEKYLIDYKEALIFGLLGWMRDNNWVNTFAGSTGAKRDSSGGAVYFP